MQIVETVFVGPAPRIAVSVAGKGPLVLFLHGIRGNRRNWNHQLDVFAQQGFTAAAWDARGYGDSDDYDGPLNFRDHFVGDVLRVAEHLAAPKLHLVGLSMGGRIARNVAIYHSDRLHSLTVVNANPGFNAMSTEEVRRFVTERSTRTPQSMRKLLGSNPRKGAYEELMDGIDKMREPSYRKTLEASVAQDRDAPIENIRVPTRVIAGEEDNVYSPELARSMAKRIPGAELVLMKRTGHLANLERPERFNEILLEFLLRHNPK
jgi:3-oxoadipate enol-lactonase